jgi:hypothetical protein
MALAFCALAIGRVGLAWVLDVSPTLASLQTSGAYPMSRDALWSFRWTIAVLMASWLLIAVDATAALAVTGGRRWPKAWLASNAIGTLLLVAFVWATLGQLPDPDRVARAEVVPYGAAGAVFALLALALVASDRSPVRKPSRWQWLAAVTVVGVVGTAHAAGVWRVTTYAERQEEAQARLANVAVPSGTGRVVLRPRYAGAPLAGLDGAVGRVTLTDLRRLAQAGLGREVAPSAPETFDVRVSHGAVAMPPVRTGFWGVRLVLDGDAQGLGENGRPLPGDFTTSDHAPVRVDVVRNGATFEVSVDLYRVFAVRRPTPSPDGSLPRLRSPVRFEWDLVAGARRYRPSVSVTRTNGEIATIGPQVTAEPGWTVELPPSEPGETYALDVLADGLGVFETYPFTVE